MEVPLLPSDPVAFDRERDAFRLRDVKRLDSVPELVALRHEIRQVPAQRKRPSGASFRVKSREGGGGVLHGLQRRRDPSSIEGYLVKSRWYGGRLECTSLTMAGEIDVDDCEVNKARHQG